VLTLCLILISQLELIFFLSPDGSHEILWGAALAITLILLVAAFSFLLRMRLIPGPGIFLIVVYMGQVSSATRIFFERYWPFALWLDSILITTAIALLVTLGGVGLHKFLRRKWPIGA